LVREVDRALEALRGSDWFAREVVLHMRRVLRRLELSARSIFALVAPGSCFVGSLFELALAADRSYMLDGGDAPARVGLSALNFGPLGMLSGLTRLQTRFLRDPSRVASLDQEATFEAADARKAGLVTFTPDEMDWEDEVRLAVEERVSLSPD